VDVHPPAIESVQEAARRHDLEGRFPRLAFLGPLEYDHKVRGVLDLVRAFADVRERYRDARLLILGDGRLRTDVESEIRRTGATGATVTGFLANPLPVLANLDLYCHISYQEGLPQAMLEAMALGLCVLASTTGGIPEVIRHGSNGYLVEGGPTGIAKAIDILSRDSGFRRRLGAQAAETIQRDFTWDGRAGEFLAAYGI
jgi:glycosyltransferase involved in cell wall biosynthesis